MSITTKKIAEICGVSRGTVDRALNGRAGIKRETRDLIIKTAKELGYRPHLLARSLVKGRTMSIGIVLFDLYNRFFAQLADAIESRAKEEGYFVYLTLTNKDEESERECIEHLAGRQVDGIILCSAAKNEEYAEYLEALNIPVVTIANRVDGFPFTGIDDKKGMKEAALHIMQKGYRQIIYISPPLANRDSSNIYAQYERYRGFIEAIEEKDKDIAFNVIDNRDFLMSLDCLIEDSSLKTAILCSSDIYALEVLNHLKSKHVKVPDDVGLMGFDNIDMLKYIEPSLATVSYPVEEIGVKAVECLLKKINDEKQKEMCVLEHKVIAGQSL